MKAGIVFFNQNHYESVVTLSTYFNEQYIETSIFLSQRLRAFVEPILLSLNPTPHIFSSDEGEGEYEFIRKHITQIRSFDYVIFDEFFNLKKNWRFLGLAIEKRKSWLIVYNACSWFKPRWGGKGSTLARTLVRTLLVRKFGGIIVSLENIKEFIERQNGLNHKVVVLPFSLEFDRQHTNADVIEEKVRLVIPGMVDPGRRNYSRILDAIESIPPHECPVSLTLLGRANHSSGIEILARCKALVKKGYVINTFDAFVPTQVFDKLMMNSDMIFSDIQKEMVIDNSIEVYGRTKDTGVTYLMTKYHIPAILPSHFETAKELMELVLGFEDEDSLRTLIRNLSREHVINLKNHAAKISSEYIEKLHQNFQNTFTGEEINEK